VNPRHLFIGTNRDNVDDKVRKGRQSHLTGNPKDVIEIRKLQKLGVVQRVLARRFNVLETTISAAINGQNWAWLK
jgi:hypothetical protein